VVAEKPLWLPSPRYDGVAPLHIFVSALTGVSVDAVLCCHVRRDLGCCSWKRDVRSWTRHRRRCGR
jgi:hypothetical protein